MALEIPNVLNAVAVICGAAAIPAAPFTARLSAGVGVAAAARTGVGTYELTLEQGLNGNEACVLTKGPLNFDGSISGQMNAVGDKVLVNAYDKNGSPLDIPFFDIAVMQIPGSTKITMPVTTVPTPGAGLPFSAAVMTAATVDKVLKPGIINRVDAAGGAFAPLMPDTTVAGAVAVNTVIVIKDVSRVADVNLTITAVGPAQLELPTSGALAATFAPAAAEGLYLAYQYDGTDWNVVGYSLH